VDCGSISKEVFSILANPSKYGMNISWNCDSCQASAARLEERMNALEGRFMEVENRVVRSEAVVQENTRRVETVEARQTRLEQEMERERERVRRERADEMREREIRRKNVIMHRVGEAREEVRAAEDRRAWDLQSCDNIFKALNLNMTSEKAVRFCRRVGEKGNGPRPLVVGFRREEQKEDILENAKKLRNTQFPEVMIIPDLTQEQRKEEADMVAEAERRNRDLTAEDAAKNLEWMAVGARGERRLIKGVKRATAARGRQPQTATRSGAAAGSSLAPALLPARPQADSWGPRTGARGAASGARGTGNKRRWAERDRAASEGGPERPDEEEEDEMDSRQPPPPSRGGTKGTLYKRSKCD
jgi:hypothetical protein